jgi:hypothetical protein
MFGLDQEKSGNLGLESQNAKKYENFGSKLSAASG